MFLYGPQLELHFLPWVYWLNYQPWAQPSNAMLPYPALSDLCSVQSIRPDSLGTSSHPASEDGRSAFQRGQMGHVDKPWRPCTHSFYHILSLCQAHFRAHCLLMRSMWNCPAYILISELNLHMKHPHHWSLCGTESKVGGPVAWDKGSDLKYCQVPHGRANTAELGVYSVNQEPQIASHGEKRLRGCQEFSYLKGKKKSMLRKCEIYCTWKKHKGH